VRILPLIARVTHGCARLTLKLRPARPDSSDEVLSRDRDRLAADLAAARQRIGELQTELSRLGSRDPLTGELLSLAAFRAQLELDIHRAKRYKRPLAVALLDIDRFRYLNLRRGYGAGDLVLGAVGGLIASGTRVCDLACRVGADEFAVMFPETPARAAAEAMQRILVEMEDLEAGGIRGLSASVGIAPLGDDQSPEAMLAAAGSALEQSRAAGGGQAVVFRGEDDGEADQQALASGHGDVIAALASALGERDRYTGEHSESVVELTAKVGESLALDAEEIALIRTAALLHDIGKVGVPDEILHKPGPLDEGEWEIMRQHPVIGERIVRAIPGMGSIARIVRHEHERWDGAGYPDGLVSDAIPVGARIILACDAYHAMTSDRPYRSAMSHREAIAELTTNAGTQFDPNVVEALVGCLFGRRQAGLAVV
jgi:diguanylate cyclase (GGDEF)-like protein/putative nucleotidyltransferase with HDIG domain